MAKEKKLRICLAASGGGHLIQLLKLADSWKGYDTFFVTTTHVVEDKLRRHGQVFVVGECNRQKPLRVMKIWIRCAGIVFRQRPNVVISTGAAAGCITCFMAKLLGAKIIWVDSITNVEKLSLSGSLVRCIADLFLVQWKELASLYKKVEFTGAII